MHSPISFRFAMKTKAAQRNQANSEVNRISSISRKLYQRKGLMDMVLMHEHTIRNLQHSKDPKS